MLDPEKICISEIPFLVLIFHNDQVFSFVLLSNIPGVHCIVSDFVDNKTKIEHPENYR